MAKYTPRSRRANTPSSSEIGIELMITTGMMTRNGSPASCRRLTTTRPKPIWATGAREISPIQPRIDTDSTSMPMITP